MDISIVLYSVQAQNLAILAAFFKISISNLFCLAFTLKF